MRSRTGEDRASGVPFGIVVRAIAVEVPGLADEPPVGVA